MLPTLLAVASLHAGLAPPEQPPRFETDVRPLFEAKCLRCHGDKVRKADLDLRTLPTILKGGESGPALVPGKPDTSLLFEKVHEGTMPPGKKDRLGEPEVALLRRWIEAGAPGGATVDTQPALTQHDVIPILLRRCTVCHGPRQQEGGLDLRTRASMLRGGKSGPAIVPGKPGASLLIKKVRNNQMPPLRRIVEVSIKPIEPAETDVLSRWIALGAPEVAVEPDVATTAPDPLVSDKDRAFWAFRAPQPAKVPTVRHAQNVRNPIDAFLLERLEARGLDPAPEADRATLLRRVYLDLVGLPPEPAEVRAFLADKDPRAYEKVVDRLLASPRHGERWARHWLDVAGYADSEGKREQDQPRQFAWRYRDYVIRACNADKPYDRFLVEQLAGDELADAENARAVTPEMADNLVATGFLRMAPDPTWYNLTNYLPDRLDVIADEMDVLGSAVLGLTLKCARCHTHKFDPIPHRDYYRLVAVFKGALDEYDWLKPDIRPGLGPMSVDILPGRLLPFVTTAERKAWEAAKTKSPEPKIQALWDRGEPSPTYIYRRGDPNTPGALVGPGVPSVLTDGKTPLDVKPPWPGSTKTGRRLAFARWLTQPDNPLTARVLVNRIWRDHFGTGIVASLGNFGKTGTPPTHPELLDWLAREFVHRGWSIKAIQKLMMMSETYRQSSAVTPELAKLDPANALLSRMPLTRLDAESLYDSLLLVAGRLDETRGGPADAVQVRRDGLVTPTDTAAGWRRLVYVQQTRKQLPTHLETFDFPQMNPNCLERRNSTVAPQALHLLNNGMVEQLATDFAKRIRREAGGNFTRQVEAVYLTALSRLPTAAEKKLGCEMLEKLADEWEKQQPVGAKPDRDAAEQKALATYCHAIVNSAAFLYVD
jgi:mono/diheme cytochrome c family protein